MDTQGSTSIMEFRQNAVLPYALGVIFIGVGIYLIVVNPQQLIFDALFAVAGAAAILLATSTRTTIDRGARTMIIVTSGIINHGRLEVGFDEITDVALVESIQQQTSTQRESMPKRMYAVMARCKDGHDYTITSSAQGGVYISGIHVGPDIRVKMVEKASGIAAFIGVPFVDQRAPTLGDVMSAITSTVRQSIADAQAGRQQPQQPPLP